MILLNLKLAILHTAFSILFLTLSLNPVINDHFLYIIFNVIGIGTYLAIGIILRLMRSKIKLIILAAFLLAPLLFTSVNFAVTSSTLSNPGLTSGSHIEPVASQQYWGSVNSYKFHTRCVGGYRRLREVICCV